MSEDPYCYQRDATGYGECSALVDLRTQLAAAEAECARLRERWRSCWEYSENLQSQLIAAGVVLKNNHDVTAQVQATLAQVRAELAEAERRLADSGDYIAFRGRVHAALLRAGGGS